DAVQELRERIFRTTQPARAVDPTQAAPAENVLLRLSPAELMRYGFVDNRGMLVIAAATGLASQAGVMDGIGAYFARQEFTAAAGAIGLSLAIVAVGLFVTLLLAVRLLSLLWALVTLHDFTVSRLGADLRIRYGLLTRVALTLRLSRVQAVHQTESLMHRFFG